MDGRQKPDAQPEHENDLNDEEIIDLKQVVQEGNDDEIIDLTNILDQPEQEPEALNEAIDRLQDTDEEIIDLSEPASAVDAGEDIAATAEKEDDNEIIDLTDIETTLEADLSETAPEEDAGIEDDEEIIDLLDAVEPEAPEAETVLTETLDASSELSATAEEGRDLEPSEEQEGDEEIIDLTDMETALDADLSETAPEDDAGIEDDEDIIDLLDAVEPGAPEGERDDLTDDESQAETAFAGTPDSSDEPDFRYTEAESAAFVADQDFTLPETETVTAVEEMSSPASSETNTPTDTVPLTEQQLEAALERTIKRVYAERIEQLLIQTIEKTIQGEIEKIKQALMEDDSDVSD